MSEMLLKHFDLLANAPDGVARLRELILILAVQGKLVPQDPTDEPASVLLQRIRTEKDRLVAEGKIKRDKPLSKISHDDAPFVIPDSWSWIQLSDLAEQITKGTTPTTFGHSYTAAGINFVKIENIDRGRLNLERMTEFISHETHEIMGRSQLAAGDVLFSIAGTIGKTAVVLECDLPANTNQALAIIKGAAKHVNQQFLLFALDSFVSDQVKAKARGGAMNNISLGDLSSLQISIPPLNEQSRIVARVEELMRLCDALDAKSQLNVAQHSQLLHVLLDTLTDSATFEELAAHWERVSAHFDLLLDRPEAVDALEQNILQLAVRGLLVPQDPADEPASVLLQRIRAEKDRLIAEGKIKRDKPLRPITDEEKPFELPMGWAFCRLGDLLLSIRSGGTPSKQNPSFWDGDIPWASVKDLSFGDPITDTQDRITQAGLEAGSELAPAGSILICTRMGLGKIGEALVDVAINQDLKAVTLGNGVDKRYFINYFKTLSVVGTGMTVAGIKQEELLGFVVRLPPLDEQSRIVARVEELRRLCNELRQRLIDKRTAQRRLAEALVEGLAA